MGTKNTYGYFYILWCRQPPMPVHCDNLTATGIANDTVKKQRSRSMEMRFILGGRSSQDGKFWCAVAHRSGEPCRLFHQAFQWNTPSRGKTLVPTREEFYKVPTKSSCTGCVGTLANGYIKSVPLPRVSARAAHITTVTARRQALTPVPYGLAPVPLSSPMTKHQFSHEPESFVQPLIM